MNSALYCVKYVIFLFLSLLIFSSCDEEADCAGVAGGSAIEDDCGVCDGDNSTCADCAGVANGTSVEDCAGTCDGTAEEDCAGVCEGDATTAYCDGCTTGVFDCAGTCDGAALEDDCSVCDTNAANDNLTCSQDCADVWGGEDVLDCAGVCGGNNTADCVTGRYNIATFGIHENIDCSGEATTGECAGYDDIDEADCPDGYCSTDTDTTILTQADCEAASGDWLLGYCDSSDEEIRTEADCPTGDWELFGWKTYIEYVTSESGYVPSITFTDSVNCMGIGFFNGNCTWELTGSDITIDVSGYCEDSDYTTQEECEAEAEEDEGWNYGFIVSATVSSDNSTITFIESEAAHCNDSNIDTEEDCTGNAEWHPDECLEFTFTKQ